MSNTKAHSLELFFIDGKPDGMLTAQIFNWTMTPRTQLSVALKRTESRYTGVYLLPGEGHHGPLAYIGEGAVTPSVMQVESKQGSSGAAQ